MQTVLITGASSGVGAAAARSFSRIGARVILVARSEAPLVDLAHELGVLAHAMPCDAADADQVAQLKEEVLTQFGVPDILVHSAGAGQWKTVQDTLPSEAVSMMQAPYFAAFNITHAFLGGMLERNSGTILTVNSPASIVPWPGSVGYAAARGALKTFHDALSQDLSKTDVSACHVIFGRIDTPYFENNPGSLENMPALDRLIPTMTAAACGDLLVQHALAPRHQCIHPVMLALNCRFAMVFPGFARWMARF